MPEEMTTADKLREEGVEFTETTVPVAAKVLHPANMAKLDAIRDFLLVLDDDDVDKMFLEVFGLAEKLEFKLQAKPMILLQRIDRAHESA